MIYGVLIYLILGVLFSYMYSSMIRWAVKNDRHRIDKRFLLFLCYIYFILLYPKFIYGVLKKDVDNFEKSFGGKK